MASTTYYPEMGGEADATAMFQSFSVIGNVVALRWQPERDAQARAEFKRLRIRPSRIELDEARTNGPKWTALCTYEASRKLYDAGLVCREMLLD